MAGVQRSASSNVSEILRTCIAGSAFGAALTLARVYLPDVIINQMRLRDFHMLEVFLSATSFSSLVFLSLEKLGLSSRVTRGNSKLAFFTTSSRYDGNILGGLLIGTGMALAGACPGTVIVQLAQGIPIARMTTLGAIIGGTAWALTGEHVVTRPPPSSGVLTADATTKSTSSDLSSNTKPVQPNSKNKTNAYVPKPTNSRVTIPEALGMNSTTVYVSFLLLLFGITAASVMYLPGKRQLVIPSVLAGGLVALAQALSLVIADTPLGTSAAYEQVGRYIARALSVLSVFKPRDVPTFPPKSIIFASGMALGSVLVSKYEEILVPILQNVPLFSSLPFSTIPPPPSFAGSEIPVMQALSGGFVLSYGARMAGGCTSGHGISGLSSLSWASLISVLSMFGGGIAVRLALDMVTSS